MDKYAIIVAGGLGIRMGTSMPKQFLLLRNKPILWYTITAFLTAFTDIQIILVLPESYLEAGRSIIKSTSDPGRMRLTIGGETRFQSVKNGLKLIPHDCIVFIHDGVRCLLTPQLIQRCFDATVANGNAIPAVPPVDTIRIESLYGNPMVDRKKVKIVQTPQTFLSNIIKPAFAQEYHESFTDEASVVEKFGGKIFLVEGEFTNIKITHQIDLLVAEKIIEKRESGLNGLKDPTEK